MHKPDKRDRHRLIMLPVGVLCLILVMPGCQKPADQRHMIPRPSIGLDLVYQYHPLWFEGYNAFDSANVISLSLDQLTKYADISMWTRQFSDSTYISPCPDSLIPFFEYRDWLWLNAHSGSGNRDYFVYSLRAIGNDQGQIDYATGGLTVMSTCNRCTKRNFNSRPMIFLSFQSIANSARIIQNSRVWAYCLVHEMGHLYACLGDASVWPIDHCPYANNTCVMHWLNTTDIDYRNRLLQDLRFCACCDTCIGIAAQAP